MQGRMGREHTLLVIVYILSFSLYLRCRQDRRPYTSYMGTLHRTVGCGV